MNGLVPLAIALRLTLPFLSRIPVLATQPFDSSHLVLDPLTDHRGLKWDAIHYTSIALHGYQYEQQAAWMPLWPWIMRYSGLCIHYILRKSGDLDVADVVRGGEMVNFFMNLASTCMIYKLTRMLYPHKQFAEITTLFYIFSPTPAPNASPYTEPSYALFTMLGIYLACKRRWWVSAVSLGLATGIRGTGVFGGGVLGWMVVFDGRQRAFSSVGPLIRRVCLAIPLCMIVISPFLAFEYYTYLSFCMNASTTRPWCEKTLPISYTFIQAEYWNVGFLKYWTTAQIPNLVIALPVILPALYGSYLYLLSLSTSTLPRLTAPASKHTGFPQPDVRLLPFHLHSLHQTLLLIFSAHTQIALRVAITNPVIYWNLASMCFDWTEPTPRKMKPLGKAWVGWSVIWGAIGIVLWAGHYPPA